MTRTLYLSFVRLDNHAADEWNAMQLVYLHDSAVARFWEPYVVFLCCPG